MEEMDLIIENGTIVTPSSSFKADVGVKNGKVAAIAASLADVQSKETVDASGKYVLPGAIDAHTHMAMPFGGTVSADDYFTGTRAAACGGVTMIINYVTQRKGQGIVETVDKFREDAEKDACVDVGFHCCITDLMGGKLLDEFNAAADYGVTSLKCFTVYKKEGMMVTDSEIVQILQKGKETGILTNVHCENPDVIDLNTEKFLKEGKTSAWYHYLSRPEFVEAEADKRVLHWAKSYDAPVYIVHLANKEGIEEMMRVKEQGYEVYAETCPQYLNFTCDVYKRENARNFVCSPPMKGEESRKALWQAIKDGFIDTVATDHCPFQSFEKDWGKDDFTKIPNGCPGVENLYPYMLSEANKGNITFNKAVELCSANPAKIFGCTQKGSLDIGKDADIVVYDQNKDFTVSVDNMHSNCDNTIWEGVKMHGYPVMTYCRGKLVYNDGTFTGEKGYGRYVKRARHKARGKN